MAMIILTTEDFKTKMPEYIMNQIIDGDMILIEDVEKSAITQIKDILGDIYDIDTEIIKIGDDRNKSLVRWILNIVVYNIYERIPDDEIPKRVDKNYENTLSELRLIARGKQSTTLSKQTADDGSGKTVFRWGSNTRHSH